MVPVRRARLCVRYLGGLQWFFWPACFLARRFRRILQVNNATVHHAWNGLFRLNRFVSGFRVDM